MNSNQKKYTVLSAIAAVLSVVCAVLLPVFMLDLNGIDLSDTEIESGAALFSAIFIALAVALASLLILIFSASLCGGFALAAYKFAQKAIRAEAEGESRAILPRVLNAVAIVELTLSAIFILLCFIVLMLVFLI